MEKLYSYPVLRPIDGIQHVWKLARLLHQDVVRNWRPILGSVAAWSLEKPLLYAIYRRVFPTVSERVVKVNRKALKMLYRNLAKDEGGFSEKEISTLGRGFVYLSLQMAGWTDLSTYLFGHEMIVKHQPRWKEELECVYGTNKFVVEMTMGKLHVFFPTQATWDKTAPDWAKGLWATAQKDAVEWCKEQNIPFDVDESAWVEFE